MDTQNLTVSLLCAVLPILLLCCLGVSALCWLAHRGEGAAEEKHPSVCESDNRTELKVSHNIMANQSLLLKQYTLSSIGLNDRKLLTVAKHKKILQ